MVGCFGGFFDDGFGDGLFVGEDLVDDDVVGDFV